MKTKTKKAAAIRPVTTLKAVRNAMLAVWEKMIEPLVDWDDTRHRARRVRHT